MTSSSPAIEVKDLHKVFKLGFWGRAVEVLHGVSLTVPERSCFGFLGPNGAGKTTTIKTIVGLIGASSGEVRLFGRSPSDAQARARVGYLPENPTFHDHLTGREVLGFACELLSVPRERRAERIEKVLDQVKIAYAGNLQVRRYSKGMTQRLGIAQALLHEPELVILDEPMSGLDPVGRRDMKDLIISLRDQKRTVFFSTHIISDVEEVCDEAAIVVGGKVARAGRVSDMLGTEAREVEVLATDVPADFEGANAQAGGRVQTFTRPDELAARTLVEALWARGAKVVSYKTRLSALESVFLEEVAKQPARRAEE